MKGQCLSRDYTRPDLPSGSESELGGASGGSGVPDLSAALAGENSAIITDLFRISLICSPSF